MKKHFSIILAALPWVAMLLFSCNRIEDVGIAKESTAPQNTAIAQSVKVTQDVAQRIANMFMRSDTGNPSVATKGASSKRVSS